MTLSARPPRSVVTPLTPSPSRRSFGLVGVLVGSTYLLVACGGETASPTGQTGLAGSSAGGTKSAGGATSSGAGGSVIGTAGSGPIGVAGTSAAGGSSIGVGGAGGSGGTTSGKGGTSSSKGGTGGSGLAGSGGQAAIDCAATCDGCCDPGGICRDGGAINACGKDGARCTRCDAIGFACTAGACTGAPPTCQASCAGCCDASGLCRFGSETDACGTAGGACVDCGASAQGCAPGGICQGAPPPTCDASNCGGCCDAAGVCQTGTTTSACGEGGVACAACAGDSECSKVGHFCSAPLACGATTCPGGCCDAQGACRAGTTNVACGDNGSACTDCTATGEACAPQGFCFAGVHCGPDNCAGCCTLLGECKDGSTEAACGQFGNICDGCDAGESCDGFVCSSGSTCPEAYAGCNPKALTVPPKKSAACDLGILQNVANACAGDAENCGPYFETLAKQNAACYGCLLQFTSEDAYPRCLASFVPADCNHELTCAVQCQAGCDTCTASKYDTCVEASYAKGGACADHIYGYYCSLTALGGGGAICEFSEQDDFGSWLARVGQAFCASP